MNRFVAVALVSPLPMLSACDGADSHPTAASAVSADAERTSHRNRAASPTSEVTLDIGVIRHGQTATARHVWVNRSGHRRGLKARVGCGCTRVSISPATLEPGESAVVLVSYDSSVLKAPTDDRGVREAFTVFDQDTGDELLIATVLGTVKPGLVAMPDQAVIRRATLDGPHRLSLELSNRTDTAVRVTKLEVVKHRGVTAAVTAHSSQDTIGPGSAVRVDLVILNARGDPFNAELVVVAEPAYGSGESSTRPLRLRVPIAAVFEDVVSVVPTTVVFRAVTGGGAPTERVRLAPTSGTSMRLLSVEADHPLISASIEQDSVVLRYAGEGRDSGWMTIAGEVDGEPFTRRVRVIAAAR